MKKILFILLAFFVISSLPAQKKVSKSFDKIYKKYKSEEKVLALDLQGDMLNFLIKNSSENNSISNIKLLVFNNGAELERADQESLLNELKNSSMEQLASMRSDDSKVDVFVKDEGDYIKKLIMIVVGDDNDVIAELNGNVHYDTLKDLDINLTGMENLGNLKKGSKP